MFEMTRWYMRLGNWSFNLVLLNILWFLFSALGLFIFGLFPATAAMFAVLRHMMTEDEDVSVTKLFCQKYKQEFWKANLLGYLILLGSLLLFLNLRALQQFEQGFFRTAFASVTVLLSFLFLLMALYIYPIFVHFKLDFWQYPKYAFIMVIAKPLQTIIMVVGVVTISFFYLKFPVFMVIFGISLFSFVLMKVALMSLPREELVTAE
ncbi:hypothetical protein AJ85_02360 [Alkalihalobacillus alcalophilus ATCC 27647 = CGMCC 1.3604]|uniref:DUF624 domain-containing protein n=1 Tax=Alkalihalobacillus alcalophilus ATCC 27647 = CGMCC 1.3604 TaxID=1218173 RepID=A0A094YR97_ALKAL|nr:DUF624 domain-containing protein [Alkalihalobacillus alcalophilus]KGA96002.1 hypothetical protein BALCAV_0218920 [Alkalihalobacillus alcalophilus ATCC 27647 = CGMCC 1.3604]MED1562475.1 DUF624 domain-containing protein [Alkalihalobacillus alcalophilus]THG88568.1 hypothetical protein AJ85_02360 [Alkalihalobacillus alcalophilus ATCC 27647 = CGMCC 1.3604]